MHVLPVCPASTLALSYILHYFHAAAEGTFVTPSGHCSARDLWACARLHVGSQAKSCLWGFPSHIPDQPSFRPLSSSFPPPETPSLLHWDLQLFCPLPVAFFLQVSWQLTSLTPPELLLMNFSHRYIKDISSDRAIYRKSLTNSQHPSQF